MQPNHPDPFLEDEFSPEWVDEPLYLPEGSSHPGSPKGIALVAMLLQSYPLVIWGALLALALVAAGVAVNNLMNPSLSRREERPGPIPPLAEPSDTEADPDAGEFPLWSVGAIALACAGTTFLLSRHLAWSAQRQELPAPLSWEEVSDLAAGFEFEEEFEEDEFEEDEALLLENSTAGALPTAFDTPFPLPFPVQQTPTQPIATQSTPAQPPALQPAEFPPLPVWERLPLQNEQAPGLAEVLEIQRRRSQKPKA